MAPRFLAAALIVTACLCGTVAAEEPNPVVVATPPQPAWGALSAEQRTILAPLAGEWDRMENYRRKKWLGIANRFQTMSPERQQRLQERMRKWAALTPAERLAARKKYRELDPEQKAAMQQKWREYEQLPEEEKRRLREARAARKAGAKAPAPQTQQSEKP